MSFYEILARFTVFIYWCFHLERLKTPFFSNSYSFPPLQTVLQTQSMKKISVVICYQFRSLFLLNKRPLAIVTSKQAKTALENRTVLRSTRRCTPGRKLAMALGSILLSVTYRKILLQTVKKEPTSPSTTILGIILSLTLPQNVNFLFLLQSLPSGGTLGRVFGIILQTTTLALFQKSHYLKK